MKVEAALLLQMADLRGNIGLDKSATKLVASKARIAIAQESTGYNGVLTMPREFITADHNNSNETRQENSIGMARNTFIKLTRFSNFVRQSPFSILLVSHPKKKGI